MFQNSLSGRFLILTIVFVMVAEVLIFVPSVARFREDYLLSRLERAQIASLALLANDMIDTDLEQELLQTAGIYNVVLRRDEMRQLVLSSPIPSPVSETFDLRDVSAWVLIRDALFCLTKRENSVIRVIGDPVQKAGLLIEVTMDSEPLRLEMLDYGTRILALSAVISIVTAFLLFLSVRRFLVRPIKGLVAAIKSYAEAPEDARRIISPEAGLVELHEAEVALQSMETQLTNALRQKERLAQLGGAVAKISHDLRNILTTAQLFADRMEETQDPEVKRVVPKLFNSITRAVNLCESTLAFGKAEEPPPKLTWFKLSRLVEDVVESERIAHAGEQVVYEADVPEKMEIRADQEQLHRVLTNLVRNAHQALLSQADGGKVQIKSQESAASWSIEVCDTGPGLPPKAVEYLFQPFHGGARKGGVGLGLVIAAELVRGHGGRLELTKTGHQGTTFTICLPKQIAQSETAVG